MVSHTFVSFRWLVFTCKNQLTIVALLFAFAFSDSTSSIHAQDDFAVELQPVIETYCLHCHDEDTETRLNFESLGNDLSNEDHFRHWVKVYDRIVEGEMPPAGESRPTVDEIQPVLDSLKDELTEANIAKQKKWGRTPQRRLTRLEYQNTLHDLLSIDKPLATILPAETDSGVFDTVGKFQGISPVHIQAYMTAADEALEAAIQLSRKPSYRERKIDYLNSPYVTRWFDIPMSQGGKMIKKLDDGIGVFVDFDYVMPSNACGLNITAPGKYRITIEASALQASSPVTLKMIQNRSGSAELIGAFDLQKDERKTFEMVTHMNPGDSFYPSVADLDPHAGVFAAGDAQLYDGEGIAVHGVTVEGPLLEAWPPQSTMELFGEVEFKKSAAGFFSPEFDAAPLDKVEEIVARLAKRVFRRPVSQKEVDSFVGLAKPALEEGRDFHEAIRLPLRSMFVSPQFLFFDSAPGKLNDFQLASRLSYFLWRSLPDDELYELAEQGQLSEPKILEQQVERMLDDEKSTRFVQDFVGQAYRLYQIDATSPDEHLYPEFDDVLNNALTRETELFIAELVKENLSVANLIDSDFTFLNRRLAEHYRIDDVDGQQFRKVSIPESSTRGGLLTQASILKTTANGTVTSPVTRGNFVLANILGTPPEPPLPNVGSIEPDIRGASTIREKLVAHRDNEQCAMCHREIDPPGFALESFDPIGGFRVAYRKMGREVEFQGIVRAKAYRTGPKVDQSGVMADGKTFEGIREFKALLMDHKEQVARNFISQLLVFSTGAEIEFADRPHVDSILKKLEKQNYPVRQIIHEVIKSELFQNQ